MYIIVFFYTPDYGVKLVLTSPIMSESINVYEYLDSDHTLINDLVNFDHRSLHEDSISDSDLFDEQNGQFLHDCYTAIEDNLLSNEVYIHATASSRLELVTN